MSSQGSKKKVQVQTQGMDGVLNEILVCIEKIAKEFVGLNLSSDTQVEKGVTHIVFCLGSEYYLCAQDSISAGYVVGSGNIVRSAIENLADAHFILKSKEQLEKYGKKYIDSLKVYQNKMEEAHNGGIDAIISDRMLKQINKWSGGASIDDRLNSLSSSVATSYDLFSYFSHPNPASISYMQNIPLKDAQLDTSELVNCQTILFLMVICVVHGSVKSVTFEILDSILNRLEVEHKSKLSA